MRAKPFALAIAFLSAAFAGCVGTGGSDAQGSDAGGSLQDELASVSENATWTMQDILPSTPLGNGSVALSQCSSVQFGLLVPPTANPGSRPPDWEPAGGTTVFGGIGLVGYHCQRIALGPFERGPVHLIFESHGAATFPPECVREAIETDLRGIVSNFWIDDAQIAAYVNATYGIPVRVADIERTEPLAGPANQETWTWGEPGAEPSTFTVTAPSARSPLDQGLMAFWPSGTGIARLYGNFELKGMSGSAHGVFKPPMLMSEFAQGAYAGETTWSTEGDGRLQFTLYRDRFCEEPIP